MWVRLRRAAGRLSLTLDTVLVWAAALHVVYRRVPSYAGSVGSCRAHTEHTTGAM
jgi:hypothetical protein